QPDSWGGDANAVSAGSAMASPRSDPGTGSEGGTGGTAGEAGDAGDADRGSSRRASASAAAPSPTLTAAVVQRLARTPTYSIRKKPASAVPSTAPKVFRPYSRPSDAGNSPRSAPMNARVRTGRVPPISVVGTSNTSAANANRSATLAPPPNCHAPAAMT